MNEQTGANRGRQKRRSFTEAVAMFAPIVPLPGNAPRASVTAVPDALDDDLPPAIGPQPIPLPLRLRAAVLPSDALPAPVRTAPERPDDDLLPVQGPQPIAIPLHPLASPSPPSQAVPEPEAERIAEVPARPEPMDNAAFHQSIAPPSLLDMPGQAAAAAAGRTRPRRRRVWLWAALLVLSAAGGAAFWVRRAPEPLVAEPQSVGPTAELAALAALAPAGVASSPEAAPAPPPPADIAAEPVLPSVPQAASEPAPEPIPEPAPEAVPAPGSPGVPDLAAPELDAVAAEPPSAAPPARGAASTTASPPSPLPIPPIPPAPTLISPNRRVVIYRRPTSSAAEAEAARVAAKLQPLAAQIETRTAAASFRLPTLRYFHAEDADAAQKLAAALRRPDAEWRVQGMLAQDPLPPPRSFQVWLPDR